MRIKPVTIGLLAFFLLIPWLGLKDFYSRGEAREALVAQQMFETGDYILPSGYNNSVPSKPPMLHWLISVTTALTSNSVNEFTARFPSAIAAVFFLVFVHRFMVRRVESFPWLPSLMLLTTVEWFRASVTARVDCLLSVFFGVALMLFYEWYERGLRGFPWRATLFLGLAALTKGPVGIALPVFIFSFFLVLERIPLRTVILAAITVAIPAALIASVWYLLASQHGGEQFFTKFYYENIARLSSTMEDEPHKHSVFYLYGTLLLGFMPWSLVFLFVGWRRRERGAKDCFVALWREEPFVRFCIIWAISIILFFSIPSSKRSTYLLPAYAPLAVILTHLYSYTPKAFEVVSKILGIVLSLGALILLCLSFFSSITGVVLSPVSMLFGVSSFAILAITIIRLITHAESRSDSIAYSLVAATYSVFLSGQLFFEPVFANAVSYRSFANETADIVRGNKPVYSFGDEFYGTSLYLRKQFTSIDPKTGQIPKGLVYLYEDNLQSLKEKVSPGYELEVLKRSSRPVVKRDKHMILVSVK